MSGAEENEQLPKSAGVVIGLALLPVYLLVNDLWGPDLALEVFICVGMILFAIVMRWAWRKHVWFWLTIVCILLLHAPIIRYVPFPQITVNRITLLPIACVELAISLGALELAKKIFAKTTSFEDEK